MMRRGGLVSRVAALMLLGGLVALGWVGAAAPLLREYRIALDGIARAEQTIAAAARIRAMRARSDAADIGALADSYLIAAMSDGAAISVLQQRIERVTGAASADLYSVTALPTPEALSNPAGAPIGLRLRLSANDRGLRDVLYALEHRQPVVIIERLDVRARSARALGTANPLEIELALRAFRRPGP